MQFSAVTLSLTALAAAGVALAQSQFTVNTPATLIQCQPIQITWTGGQAPYFPRITAAGQVSQTLQSFDQQTGTSLTWTVNIAAGTQVTIAIGDSAGTTAATSPVTINQGGSGCLGQSSASGGATPGSSSSGAASSTASSAASSSSSASRSSSSSASSAPSSSAASSSASRSSSSSSSGTAASPSATSGNSGNGAESVRGFSAVVAGVVGVAAAALL